MYWAELQITPCNLFLIVISIYILHAQFEAVCDGHMLINSAGFVRPCTNQQLIPLP